MESSDFKIIKRFGPSVLKVKIPKNIIETLNNHFDKIILDKRESKRLNLLYKNRLGFADDEIIPSFSTYNPDLQASQKGKSCHYYDSFCCSIFYARPVPNF